MGACQDTSRNRKDSPSKTKEVCWTKHMGDYGFPGLQKGVAVVSSIG